MKKILIISATKNSNYKLAKNLKKILLTLNINVKLITLEDYYLPIYTDTIYENKKNENLSIVKELTSYFINSDGFIICAPEYNGSTPPIISNVIAWISVSTTYWKDAFKDKVAMISTSSGGPGTKFISTMKLQLEHLGVIVNSTSISANKSNPLDTKEASKILKQFINLI